MRSLKYLPLLLLAGCSLTPDYWRPSVALPEQWRSVDAAISPQMQTNAQDLTQWWTRFGSEELNGLITQALAQNNDLRAAVARIQQARASAKVASSALFPSIDASGSASRSDDSNSSASENYRAQVGVAYELDLFGKNRAGVSAAESRLEGSQYDRDALALSVTADVARNYFAILTSNEQLRIARANLDNARDVLKIADARYREGATSALELSQQKSDLANNEARLATIENQRDVNISALAVLLGIAPSQVKIPQASLDAMTIPSIAPALPATLITQRPDIAKTETDLRAANADIGAARAAFFPSLSLSANIAALANPSATATSVAASVLAPIFEGGRLTGNLERSQARQMELAENYRKTVLVAFKEVEDALSTTTATGTRETQLSLAAREAADANAIARARYEAGATDFQVLLDTQRSRLSADDALAQARQARLNAAVNLYQALGGGWSAK